MSELAAIEASSTVLVAPPKRSLIVFGSLLLAITIVMGLAVTFGVGQMVERSLLKSIAFRQNVSNDILIEAARWVTWLGDAAQRSLVMVGFTRGCCGESAGGRLWSWSLCRRWPGSARAY